MNASFVVCALLFLTSAIGYGATAAEPSPEVQAILDRTGNFGTPNFRAVQALTEEERQLLLTYFREQYRIARSPEPLSNIERLAENPVFRMDLRKRSETALAMLADPELMGSWMRDAKEAPADSYDLEPAMRNLALAAKPDLVIEIAPFIMTGEPVTTTYVSDTRTLVSKNAIAGYTMLKIIERSPAFDAQTRKWAQDQRQANATPLLNMLPQWWKENEAHFVAKNYKAVKPGEDIYNPAMEKSRQEYAEMRAREAEMNATEKAAATARAAIVASTKPADRKTVVATVLPYTIIGVMILLLAGGLWLYGRSART
jgi:hypothetical protein